jgi:hypothetical protein
MSDKWLAKVFGLGKAVPFSFRDYRTEWIPQFPFLDHIQTVDQFLDQAEFTTKDGERLATGDIVVGKFGDTVVLAQYNGNGFNEIERTTGNNYAYRWRNTIEEMISLNNKRKGKSPSTKSEQVFVPCGPQYRAKMMFDGTICRLLKTSEISGKISANFPHYKNLISSLLKGGAAIQHPIHSDKMILKEDFDVSSPSAAATLVTGVNQNGNVFWKNQGLGCKLKDLK